MQLTSVRDIDEDVVAIQFNMQEAELHLAFEAGDPAGKELFFQLFGPGWDALKTSEKLAIVAQVAARAESAQASILNLSGSTEPKP